MKYALIGQLDLWVVICEPFRPSESVTIHTQVSMKSVNSNMQIASDFQQLVSTFSHCKSGGKRGAKIV